MAFLVLRSVPAAQQTTMLRRASALNADPYETGKLSFGCPVLDTTFGGGLPVHGITEICGEAGCGKTQLCIQLAVQAMLPVEYGGLAGKTVYVTSGEGTFPAKRLEQLARLTAERFKNVNRCADEESSDANRRLNQNSGDSSMTGVTKDKLLNGVFIHDCPNVEALLELVENGLAGLLANEEIRLVIVDSVAGAFRNDDDYDVKPLHQNSSSGNSRNGRSQTFGSNFKARTRDLFLFASHLRRLSFAHNTAIVVVNQATANGFNKDAYGSFPMPDVSPDALEAFPSLNIRPALGLTWSTCINQRIMLMRREIYYSDVPYAPQLKRTKHTSAASAVVVASHPRHGSTSGERAVSLVSGRWQRDAALLLSPCAPFRKVQFAITEAGVAGLIGTAV